VKPEERSAATPTAGVGAGFIAGNARHAPTLASRADPTEWTQPHRVTPKRAVSQQTQLLVWPLSKENPLWGYRRIQGELLKVGIEISASSIRRVHRPEATAWPQT
jgi:hypothetical protein